MRAAEDLQAAYLTVHVPLKIRKRGGRKRVLSPTGIELQGCRPTPAVDNATVRAIARAYRWRDMIESGAYSTIREIAKAEKINEAYVGRVLRLTMLAPRIIEAILSGQLPDEGKLQDLMQKMPIDWQAQSDLKV